MINRKALKQKLFLLISLFVFELSCWLEATIFLGILVFCTGFGIVISTVRERGKILVEFFANLDAVIMLWVEGLMW